MKALLVVLALAGSAHAAPDLDAVIAGAPDCSGRAHCVGLAFHIAVDDSGPVATAAWTSSQLAGANRHFEKLDVGFRIVSVDALPASAARVEDRKERDSFAPQVKGTVLHVFVTGRLDDIDKPGDWIYGVTWRARGDTKFVILSTAAWERTLAHELGHVFGLPHSTYAISIMNKTERDEPPIEKRTFADEEFAVIKLRLAWLLRSKALTEAMPKTPAAALQR